MDYRLTDPYLDPPGADQSCYSERTIRLPASYCVLPGSLMIHRRSAHSLRLKNGLHHIWLP